MHDPVPITTVPSKDERLWAMLSHLVALAGLLPILFGQLIGPLTVWLIKKNESAFVDDQGKESLNFQLTMTIAGVIATLLIPLLIGIVLFPLVVVLDVVFVIVAAVKANDGIAYRYPFTIRFIK